MAIDLQFIEIEYELSILKEYLDRIEQQLAIMREQARIQTETWLRENQNQLDEVDRFAALQDLDELVDHLLPRLFRNPFLISLWAVYESAVGEIADYIKNKQNKNLGMSDIRGNILDRAKKYFNHVLEFPLYTDNQDWSHLKMLNVLRNAIVHSNGRISMIKKSSREQIETWERGDIGISTYYGYLMFTEHFLRETHLVVDRSLSDLLQRVCSTYGIIGIRQPPRPDN